jgi:hypothetical protein
MPWRLLCPISPELQDDCRTGSYRLSLDFYLRKCVYKIWLTSSEDRELGFASWSPSRNPLPFSSRQQNYWNFGFFIISTVMVTIQAI